MRICIICLWLCFITLLILGIVMVASTGLCAYVPNGGSPSSFLYKQCSFAFVGLIAALAISTVDYRILRKFIAVLWILCTLLLICCFLPGIGMTLNGESRWLNLGFMTFQPSELAKIVLIASLAHWYTTHREMAGTFWKGFVLPGIIFGIPLILILVEKDMGTAAALAVSGICVMYLAGVRGWLLMLALLLGALILYDQATGNANRVERIEAWFNPQAYSQGAGRQQWIAIQAFARGDLAGLGLGNGLEKYGNLPFAHTDFIFAEIGEEWGLIGTAAVTFLFSSLTACALLIATRTQDTFGRLLAAGLACTIFWPAALNIMVVTSLLPNSGLPLPFISYGGTNLVFTILAIGILTSIQRHTPKQMQNYWPEKRRKENPNL